MQSWKIFAALYAIGTVGYAVGAKLSGGRISPLLGVLIMTICSLAILAGFFLVYRIYGYHFTYTKSGIEAAIFAGIAISIADISLFFMYSRGAQLSVAGIFTEVIAVVAIALVGIFLLKEPITFTKTLGLIFSAIGIVFLFEG